MVAIATIEALDWGSVKDNKGDFLTPNILNYLKLQWPDSIAGDQRKPTWLYTETGPNIINPEL